MRTEEVEDDDGVGGFREKRASLIFFPKKEVSRRSRTVRTSAVNGKPHKTLGKPSHGIMFKVGGAKRPKMF